MPAWQQVAEKAEKFYGSAPVDPVSHHWQVWPVAPHSQIPNAEDIRPLEHCRAGLPQDEWRSLAQPGVLSNGISSPRAGSLSSFLLAFLSFLSFSFLFFPSKADAT